MDARAATNATLDVHTDSTAGLPDVVGDGSIGLVTLAAGSTLTLASRGDFGGLSAGAGAQAVQLSFANQTGPISGLEHIGAIDAQGTVDGVSVANGIDMIHAGALSNVSSATNPTGPVTPLTVRVGSGGVTGALAFGNQSATLYQVDDNSHVTAVTQPGGDVTAFTYDANGYPASLSGPLGTWTFHYDANGHLQTETDPNGQTRTLTYDTAGHVLTDTTTDANGGVIAQTTFTRDGDGQPLTSTGPGGTTTFVYAGGQLQSETGPSGLTETYTRDTAGNALAIGDALGGTVASTCDGQKRLLSRTFSAPGQDTLRIDYTYNVAGQVLTETRYADADGTLPAGSALYEYNTAGHVTRLQQLDASGTVLTDYVFTYDAGGRPATETRNGVLTASYTYDGQGQVIRDGTHNH